jgi:hypothetical protein
MGEEREQMDAPLEIPVVVFDNEYLICYPLGYERDTSPLKLAIVSIAAS